MYTIIVLAGLPLEEALVLFLFAVCFDILTKISLEIATSGHHAIRVPNRLQHTIIAYGHNTDFYPIQPPSCATALEGRTATNMPRQQ